MSTITDASTTYDAPQTAVKQTPLARQQQKVDAINLELNDLFASKQALENKRTQIAGQIAGDGKVTRARQAELNRVNRDLAKLERKTEPVRKRFHTADARLKQLVDAESSRRAKIADRELAKAQVRADRKAAQLQARIAKKGGAFVQMAATVTPSKIAAAAEKGGNPHLAGAWVDRIGTGKSTRWQLLVTDSYTLVGIPLTVQGDHGLRDGMFIGLETLKSIEKAGGAFRLEKSGGIQPVSVRNVTTYVKADGERIDYPPHANARIPYGTARWFVVHPAGQGYLLGEQRHKPLIQVGKAPAKSGSFKVSLNPKLLVQLAQALGGDSGNVTLEFDMRKAAGKAAEGRTYLRPIRVAPVGVDDGPEAIAMPVNPKNAR